MGAGRESAEEKWERKTKKRKSDPSQKNEFPWVKHNNIYRNIYIYIDKLLSHKTKSLCKGCHEYRSLWRATDIGIGRIDAVQY